MPEQVSIPYEWAKELSPKQLSLDEGLVFGYSDPFPLEEFIRAFSEGFELEPFPSSSQTKGWIEDDGTPSDLGDRIFYQKLTVSGIPGEIALAIDEDDLHYLFAYFLTKETPKDFSFHDKELEEGIRRYFALEAIRAFNSTNLGKPLSLHLLADHTPLSAPFYASDATLSLPGKTISVRLMISAEFQKAYRDKFTDHSMRIKVSKDLVDSTILPLEIRIGGARLSREELDALKEGDLLLLDHCTIEPETGEGTTVLAYKNRPRLNGKLAGGALTIGENGFLNEEIRSLYSRETLKEGE